MSQTLELDAVHYSENCQSQYSQASDLLSTIKLKKDASILDVGCGHGEILAELSKAIPNGKAIGVDPAEDMIQLARSEFPTFVYKNLSFIQNFAEDMDFASESFDLIICTNALMWVKKPKKVLENICRYLKPGGVLLIFTYGNDTPYVELFEAVLNESFSEYTSHSAVNHMLSVDEHRNILERNGMAIEIFKAEKTIFEYDSPLDLKNYILGWLPCYAPIPSKLQNSFINQVIVKSSKFKVNPFSNRIAIPHQTLALKAIKK